MVCAVQYVRAIEKYKQAPSLDVGSPESMRRDSILSQLSTIDPSATSGIAGKSQHQAAQDATKRGVTLKGTGAIGSPMKSKAVEAHRTDGEGLAPTNWKSAAAATQKIAMARAFAGGQILPPGYAIRICSPASHQLHVFAPSGNSVCGLALSCCSSPFAETFESDTARTRKARENTEVISFHWPPPAFPDI